MINYAYHTLLNRLLHEIHINVNNTEIAVFVKHMECFSEPTIQMNKLADIVSRLLTTMPVIIIGDFNLLPNGRILTDNMQLNNNTYKHALQPLIDLGFQTSINPTLTCEFSYDNIMSYNVCRSKPYTDQVNLIQIDYIWYKNLQLINTDVYSNTLTHDHVVIIYLYMLTVLLQQSSNNNNNQNTQTSKNVPMNVPSHQIHSAHQQQQQQLSNSESMSSIGSTEQHYHDNSYNNSIQSKLLSLINSILDSMV